jgi:hypothetical protein
MKCVKGATSAQSRTCFEPEATAASSIHRPMPSAISGNSLTRSRAAPWPISSRTGPISVRSTTVTEAIRRTPANCRTQPVRGRAGQVESAIEHHRVRAGPVNLPAPGQALRRCRAPHDAHPRPQTLIALPVLHQPCAGGRPESGSGLDSARIRRPAGGDSC